MLFLIDDTHGKTCIAAVLSAAKKRTIISHGALATCASYRHAKLLCKKLNIQHLNHLTKTKHRQPQPIDKD